MTDERLANDAIPPESGQPGSVKVEPEENFEDDPSVTEQPVTEPRED